MLGFLESWAIVRRCFGTKLRMLCFVWVLFALRESFYPFAEAVPPSQADRKRLTDRIKLFVCSRDSAHPISTHEKTNLRSGRAATEA